MKKIIMVFFLIFVPFASSAQVYDEEATGEYVMGDSDTKMEARKIALEHAKRLAVEQIGTYLESETVVKDRMLTKDEIRTYTAAIIKTTVISEDMNLLQDKTTIFKIRIKANVDVGVLNKRVQEIETDKKRKEQMDALQSENLRLLKELESLSTELKIARVTEYKKLRQKREGLFEELEKNQNSLRVVFEKGTLLNLAIKSQSKLEEDKMNIDDAFQFIAENILYEIGEGQVRHKGNMSDLIIPIRWNFEKHVDARAKILRVLDRADLDSQGRIHVGKAKGIDKDILNNYVKSKRIRIYVSASNYSEFIEIMGYWGISTQGKKDLEIKNIPVEKLRGITSINAKVVVE